MSELIVTDLDDTLVLGNGDANPQMLDLLLKAQAEGTEIAVVSGRNIDRLDETETWLEGVGLDIDPEYIHLSDFPEGPNASREFKVYKAKLLLDEGDVILAWYENDADTRQELSQLGINVKAPVGQRSLPDVVEVRATAAPAYMRDAAQIGLRLFAEGKAGDGVTAQTVREARDMAKGIVNDDKWVRIAAWIARHRIDWEDVEGNNDPENEDFPQPGAVAAYLWGVDPTSPDSADRVIAFAKQAVGERVKEDDMEETRGMTGATDLPIGDRGESDDESIQVPFDRSSMPVGLVTRFADLYAKEV
jgi:hypothetical protein